MNLITKKRLGILILLLSSVVLLMMFMQTKDYPGNNYNLGVLGRLSSEEPTIENLLVAINRLHNHPESIANLDLMQLFMVTLVITSLYDFYRYKRKISLFIGVYWLITIFMSFGYLFGSFDLTYTFLCFYSMLFDFSFIARLWYLIYIILLVIIVNSTFIGE